MSDNNNNNKIDWKSLSFGALWLKDGKYSGNVTIDGKVVRIVAFTKKAEDAATKRPDISLYFAPENDAQQSAPQQQQPAPKANSPQPRQNTAPRVNRQVL